MGLFNIYESLITEVEAASKVQACINSFGNELFAQQLGGEEENTKYEDSVISSINKYTGTGYGTALARENPDLIGKMNTLKSCISVYSEVLHPEGIVYRGINMPLVDAIDLYLKVHGKTTFKLPYKSKTYIESWTEAEVIGKQFATSYIPDSVLRKIKDIMTGEEMDSLDVPINDAYIESMISEISMKLKNKFKIVGFLISHTATPDSFLFKGKYFRELSQAKHEMEILRIGMSPINCTWEISKAEIFTYLIPFIEKYKDQMKF